MSLNFDFWSPPYDYHPPYLKAVTLVRALDPWVHCAFGNVSVYIALASIDNAVIQPGLLISNELGTMSTIL